MFQAPSCIYWKLFCCASTIKKNAVGKLKCTVWGRWSKIDLLRTQIWQLALFYYLHLALSRKLRHLNLLLHLEKNAFIYPVHQMSPWLQWDSICRCFDLLTCIFTCWFTCCDIITSQFGIMEISTISMHRCFICVILPPPFTSSLSALWYKIHYNLKPESILDIINSCLWAAIALVTETINVTQ